jgi:hypothetical protein
MQSMGRNRADKDKGGQPPPEPAKGRHREPVLGLRLSGHLVDLVRALAKKNRRPLTTEVTIALEEYLAKHGLWPPPPPA